MRSCIKAFTPTKHLACQQIFPMRQPEFVCNSRRSPVFATHAMVASSQPIATQIGLDILKAGGNAADAAVAVAAALGVIEPMSTGIGGDCFCLFFNATDGTVSGINGSGRSPKDLTFDELKKLSFQHQIPQTSVHAVTVPGACAGWFDTVGHFGSKRLSMKQILQPAIRLAEEGFVVPPISADMWRHDAEKLLQASDNHEELLIDGKAPACGDVMTNPHLARVYTGVAERGPQEFYVGEIASSIVAEIQKLGGLLSIDDLAHHLTQGSELIVPISIQYRGVEVFECPPNGQGLTALMALGIIDALQETGKIPPLDDLPANSSEYLHVIIESLRIAFADTRWYVADPAMERVPVKDLLSKEYLRERASLFNPSATVGPHLNRGEPQLSCDTVYLSVVDSDGNACSFINSVYGGFGSGIIPKGCGFALQSRGANFSLDPDSPNCYAPRKRPYHTIIPAMVTYPSFITGEEKARLAYCFGVMGAFMQPQGHLQVLLNLLHSRLDPQASLDQPRICLWPDDGHVKVEDGISPEAIESLRQKGHSIKVVSGYARGVFGRGQVIETAVITNKKSGQSHRVLMGGSDLRGDGHAAGW